MPGQDRDARKRPESRVDRPPAEKAIATLTDRRSGAQSARIRRKTVGTPGRELELAARRRPGRLCRRARERGSIRLERQTSKTSATPKGAGCVSLPTAADTNHTVQSVARRRFSARHCHIGSDRSRWTAQWATEALAAAATVSDRYRCLARDRREAN